MTDLTAIILAAGVGSRLRPLTADRPKCLLDVGGQTLLERQLEALRQAGVLDVAIVTGYRGDQIRARVDAAVRIIDSARFEDTNSLYSLWLARDCLLGGAIILNSDVLATTALFSRLLLAPVEDAVLVDKQDHFEAEDMKVTLEGEFITDFGKDLPPERAHAHNVGMAKFGPRGAVRLRQCVERLVAAGHENDWAPMAYRDYASTWALFSVLTDGLPWIEIDYLEDLERARVEIAPAIGALERAWIDDPAATPSVSG
jgi:choline kinase